MAARPTRPSRAAPRSDRMTAADFAAWLATVQGAGWSRNECARRLGCSDSSLRAWERRGAPAYVGLACAALAGGLPAWRRKEGAS